MIRSLLAPSGLIWLAVTVCCSAPHVARAAGMTTHSYMAAEAIQYVETPELKRLLGQNRLDVITGGTYPDSGYYVRDVSGATGNPLGSDNYGETSHWEYFINPYAAHVRTKCRTGSGREELARGFGPCARLVAHLMGSAAHGMGDELWDWLFEPLMGQHGEHPHDHLTTRGLPGWAELSEVPALGEVTAGVEAAEDEIRPDLIRSSEYAMDVVAIHDPAHAQLLWSPTDWPIDDLLAVYDSMGMNVNRETLVAGYLGMNAILAAERLSVLDYLSVRQNFPYTSERLGTESGGVQYTARAIARYYESLWLKVTGDAHPAPVVAAVHPEPGETGVSTVVQVGGLGGAGPDGGRADNRVLAAFSNSVDPSTITPETFRLRDSGGVLVPPLAGYPKSGPYNWNDDNETTHSMMFVPSADLAPCETYTAEITAGFQDHAGVPLAAPYQWSFTTACPLPPSP